MAPECEPSGGDKLSEMYDSANAFHPKVREMVMDYDKLTPIAERTFETVATVLLARETQLQTPLDWKAKGSAMSASCSENETEATASAAISAPKTTTITTKRLQELEEMEKKFHLTKATYCYCCGWQRHKGYDCAKMFDKANRKPIAPYTYEQVKAYKPITGGSTSVASGFCVPN